MTTEIPQKLTVAAFFLLGLIGVAFGADQNHPGLSLLTTPDPGSPTTVLVDFELESINFISSVDETFEFTGVMTLIWKDPRVAFDPDQVGVSELLFQGSYQFDELATGWYPQVVLVNDAGSLARSGVQLRVKADGTSVMKEKITAVAEGGFDMRRFSFDSHRLEVAFSILGHTSDEIDLQVGSLPPDFLDGIEVPEWSLQEPSLEIRTSPRDNGKQAAVLGIEASRRSLFVRRLITLPMAVIVLLSSCIFWMDKSSLSERNSISFIGVLTAVAYQQIVVNVMPPASYFTFMHGLLLVSFLMMSATIPVNLAVAEMEKHGKQDLADRIDRICRWLFPLVYMGMIVALFVLTRLL